MTRRIFVRRRTGDGHNKKHSVKIIMKENRIIQEIVKEYDNMVLIYARVIQTAYGLLNKVQQRQIELYQSHLRRVTADLEDERSMNNMYLSVIETLKSSTSSNNYHHYTTPSATQWREKYPHLASTAPVILPSAHTIKLASEHCEEDLLDFDAYVRLMYDDDDN